MISHMSWFKTFDSKPKTQKAQKDEIVENADLYKPVLNKIMTTQE